MNPRAHIGVDWNPNVPDRLLLPTTVQQKRDRVENNDGDDNDQQQLQRTELPQGEDGYYADLDLEEQ